MAIASSAGSGVSAGHTGYGPGWVALTFDTDRTQSPHQEIAQDTAAAAAARRHMGEAIVRTQTDKFITDGIALGYRYDPSPICWGEPSPPPPLTISDALLQEGLDILEQAFIDAH